MAEIFQDSTDAGPRFDGGNRTGFKGCRLCFLPPKVHDGPRLSVAGLCFLTYQCNKLRVDGEGHLTAPVESSEASFSSFRFPETKSAHLKLSLSS